MSKKKYEIIEKETVYDGFFALEKYHLKHTLFAGGWSQVIERELFRRTNCVAVILYDPDADKVILIEQFRIAAVYNPKPVRAWLVEIVAGAIDAGETPEQVAYRESKEEAGCEILELQLISKFYTTPGGCSEQISLFYGRVNSGHIGGIHGLDHEDEDILVSAVPFADAYQMLQDGRIESGIPIIAIQWLALNRERIRQSISL